MTKLEREWAAKLKASGFRDLEGSDRDAPLSDRGHLHAVSETDEDLGRLVHRIEHGREYASWATDVLHRHRFRSTREREIWRRHAEGEGLRDIAAALGISFHAARNAVESVKANVRQVNQVRERTQWRKRHYRALGWEQGLRLAAVLLTATIPKTS